MISYSPDLPAGSTIILVAGAAYLLSTIMTLAWKKNRANAAVD